MRKTFTLMLLGCACLLAATHDGMSPKIQVVKTERANLPAGGAVSLKNSTGEVTIEGWDQPGVEITTTKSTKLTGAAGAKLLDEVKVSAALQGSELVIATEFPRHTRFLPRPSVGTRDFDLEYLIRVPRNAKIAVEHDAGEVNIDDVTGDIHAVANQGTILLRLPQTAEYAIDAKSRIGGVTSDFPGAATRRKFGHALLEPSPKAHSLYLRTGFGDIMILKVHKPAPLQ